MLTTKELKRYERQILIDGFGKEGQAKLKQAKVFIAGAGGLGSPIAIYLTAAGVGTIRIADHDIIEPSNLNRQVLHWDEDTGRSKVASALEKLERMNRHAAIEVTRETITGENAARLVADSDLIIDAMDNLPTRQRLNKVALEKNIPFFHGAVYGFEGRAMTIIPGETACLNCLYRGVIRQKKFPVIGIAPAIIGCIQATEVIKYIVGMGELLTNRLLIFDGLEMTFSECRVKKDPACEHCGHPA
ncbi:ThiF family adenylyltransferase [Chloroflexota bacterium]